MIARLGTKLRHLRERAGLSQTELAQLIGMSERSKGYISEIESGKKIPPAEKILRIALYFNVTTDYLLRDDISEQGNDERWNMTIRYYIPDWDDRVDPNFNFITDAHTPGRNPYRDDHYAHQIYDPPPYDGLLVSRAVIDANRHKHDAILALGSVRRYLRWPQDHEHQILGDCGAFSYWNEPEPPYQTADMLEYYQTLGFDLGVSIDHLIFAEHEDEKERRWHITVDNAETFLKLHGSGGYRFTPVGVAQGWDPASYRRSAHALMQIGYSYIAVGGLVRSQTGEIIRILRAIQPELRTDTQMHLFGVNRPEHFQTFASLGVTSFDSASRLRRAWMDGKRNYFLGNDSFTAIRVPEARALAKKRDLDVDKTQRKEKKLLDCLRAYDRDELSIEEPLRLAIEYAELSIDLTTGARSDYQRTLEQRPWKQCGCRICQELGVEVIIFRGNNRNRRRGFHNTWQLYQQLQNSHDQPIATTTIAEQLELML